MREILLREILYRGKRLQGGDWIEGYFYKSDINERERASGKATLIKTPNCDTFISVPEQHNSFMVIPETVGEYTGLKDKNGTRIFEGDIVREKDTIHDGEVQIKGAIFEVIQKKGCWIIRRNQQWDFLYANKKNIEVIGNIHDNPELLEAEE